MDSLTYSYTHPNSDAATDCESHTDGHELRATDSDGYVVTHTNAGGDDNIHRDTHPH